MSEHPLPWATLRGRILWALPVALFTALFQWPVRFFLFDETWKQAALFSALTAVITFPVLLLILRLLRRTPDTRGRTRGARRR
ncbi:hypothetical protein ACIRPH_22185 [Nocardiopsis sp. NPDC101807]|uniref:hypothetical protein n=1 Tax=Nocardiopsis sp. NPDC101807 TaxID=3364339 RepID=UPI0038169EF8